MTLILVAVALVSFGLFGTGYAYHDGGVARCEGCHTMHNSLDGAGMATANGRVQFQAGPYLLKGSDASSACLNCHGAGDATSGYHISTQTVAPGGTLPAQFTPGGDFSWLKQTSDATAYRRGHSIVAADFGYSADTHKAGNVGPGGSFDTGILGCTSCHNPHGQTRMTTTGWATPSIGSAVDPIEGSGSYGAEPEAGLAVGAYRLLGGAGYTPKGQTAVAFTNNPPIAVAPSSYNSTTAKGGVRVAYGTGMSEWCANCHGSIHLTTAYTTGTNNLRHPAGNNALLTGSVGGTNTANIYNAYVSSGDLTNTQATSFDPLVPYEAQDSTIANLVTLQASAGGPTSGNETVMCLSCHRAHASAFDSMTRWDMAEALITNGTSGWERNLGPDAVLTAAYYNKTAADFGPAQRTLCNKCHARD